MLTTAPASSTASCASLRDHGAVRSDDGARAAQRRLLLGVSRLGFNYRMTDIQGALGCAQMARAPFILEQRALRARRYDQLLGAVPWLVRPRTPARSVHGYQAYVCWFAPEPPTLGNVDDLHERRNALMQRLEARGIATRQGTHAPIALGYYSRKYGLRAEDYPNAWLADRLSLALPLYPQMTDAEQDRVVAALIEVGHE